MRFRAGEKELRFHFLMGKAPGALENPFLERNSLMMGGFGYACVYVYLSEGQTVQLSTKRHLSAAKRDMTLRKKEFWKLYI